MRPPTGRKHFTWKDAGKSLRTKITSTWFSREFEWNPEMNTLRFLFPFHFVNSDGKFVGLSEWWIDFLYQFLNRYYIFPWRNQNMKQTWPKMFRMKMKKWMLVKDDDTESYRWNVRVNLFLISTTFSSNSVLASVAVRVNSAVIFPHSFHIFCRGSTKINGFNYFPPKLAVIHTSNASIEFHYDSAQKTFRVRIYAFTQPQAQPSLQQKLLKRISFGSCFSSM